MLCNNSRKNIVSRNIVICDDIFSQGTGLMFRSRDSVMDKAWVFVFDSPRKISITMMFVFFPLDLLFLDLSRRVIDIKRDIKPWSFYTCSKKAAYCIELDAGTIRSRKIKIGDKMLF